MHQAKESAGQDNGGCDAKGSGKERVQIAPKKGLLDERRHQDRHGHEQQSGIPVFEKFLDRSVLRRFQPRGQKRNEEGKTAARK